MPSETEEIIMRIDAYAESERPESYKFTVGRIGDFNPGVIPALRRRGFIVGRVGDGRWYASRAQNTKQTKE